MGQERVVEFIPRCTLNLSPAFIHQRHNREDLCSLSGLRLDRERSAHQMDPFLHANQPQSTFALRRIDVKACACVGDDELNAIHHAKQSHSELVRPAVFHSVMESFLGDPEKAQRNVLGQFERGTFASVTLMLTSCCLENSSQNPLMAATAPRLVEFRRVQLV